MQINACIQLAHCCKQGLRDILSWDQDRMGPHGHKAPTSVCLSACLMMGEVTDVSGPQCARQGSLGLPSLMVASAEAPGKGNALGAVAPAHTTLL